MDPRDGRPGVARGGLGAAARDLRERLRRRYSTGNWTAELLCVAATVIGVTSGVAVVAAVMLVGGPTLNAIDTCEQFTTHGQRLSLVAFGQPLPEEVLEALQDRRPDLRFHPVLEGHGEIQGPGGTPVHLLGLDLIGDPRLPAVTGKLDRAALHSVLRPVVFLPEELHRRPGLAPGEGIRIAIAGREASFVVDARPVPRDLTARSSRAVAVIDVAHYQNLFGRRGEIDRTDLLAPAPYPAAPSLAGLDVPLPRDAHWVAEGYGRDGCRAWAETRRTGVRMAGSAGMLIGVVVIYLSVTASYRRRPGLLASLGIVHPRGRSAALLKVGEVFTCLCVGTVGGVFGGPVLARASLVMATRRIGAAAEIGTLEPLPVALVLLCSAGLATLWHVSGRNVLEGERDRVWQIPKLPTVAAGVLLLLALAALASGRLVSASAALWPAFAGVSTFFLVAALALVGRPALIATAHAMRRLFTRGGSLGRAVLAVQLLENSAFLSLALAFVVFSLTSLTATWVIDRRVSAAQSAWFSSAFGPDLLVTPVSVSEGATREAVIAGPEAERVASLSVVAGTIPDSRRPPAGPGNDSGREAGGLVPAEGVGGLAVRLATGTSPREACRAIGEVLGTGRVVFTDLASVREPLGTAFRVASRTASASTIVVLLASALAVFIGSTGLVLQVPRGWEILLALGVPRGRFIRAASASLAAYLALGIVLGVGTGTLAGIALTRIVTGSAASRPLPDWRLGLILVTLWVTAAWVARQLLRRRLSARASDLWMMEVSG